MIRIRAIFCCLYFGIMPWQFYERDKCHYEGISYWEHMILNVKYTFVWLTCSETWEDVKFEKETNSSWKQVFYRSNRWTKFRKQQRLD